MYSGRVRQELAVGTELKYPRVPAADEPPRVDMALARGEAELVMFGAVADLLKKTGE